VRSMSLAGVRFVTAPETALPIVAVALVGGVLGVVSGLTPGLHANNFALVMAAAANELPAPPLVLATGMLTAGVVHTVLDAVPALALGVPDASMAMTALPGHRLVIAGRGREALRLSALGSGLALGFSVLLALPTTIVMKRAYPTIAANLQLVLGAVVVGLLATESDRRGRVVGLVLFAASGALGLVTLNRPLAAPVGQGSALTPLFAGLFGAPVLIDALDGGGIPPQGSPTVAAGPWMVTLTALAGTLAGAAVGYLPGVSSAIAAVLALTVLPSSGGDRGYVVATSGVNTANSVFALWALVALGSPRTGVLVAVDRVGAPTNVPVLLLAVVLGGAVGLVAMVALGDRYLDLVKRVRYERISIGVCGLLIGLSYLFAGIVGIGIFVASTALGLVPVRLRSRRVYLMGVLIGPLLVGA
jgi:putative membrane protein